ncbi:GGDEF domain-containing protein, partial [Candidatus Nomurabacteria bacterium]|nr:GGDEF domain-containing protein [Candidatus Nomurabacteria bacterium]
ASKEIENIFKYNSEHDIWTGLLNRRCLETLLKDDAKKRTPKKRAVLSINLSTVHSLSLTYGFQYSQELIKKAAKALDALSTEQCKLFITYENQFVFYLNSYRDKNELSAFSESITAVLKTVLSVEKIGAGIGIVEIDDQNKHDIDLMLKNLLVASEKAIHVFEPDICACFFDTEMAMQMYRDETISHELAEISQGVQADRLFLQYQPIWDLASNRICAFEALARLSSDELGPISPIEFIPITEKTNLIIPLGYEIIRKALHFLNRLNEKGHTKVGISINISAIQLLKNDFTANLFKIIDEIKVNPENIELEITESIFVANHENINRILGELKTYGIKIAIDDFGKGYSSLARERELNVDCLKIDKCFIDKLISLKDEETITGDIISMSHKLGHYVVAEGVEHEKQYNYLVEHHCDKIQGFLISRPLDEDVALDAVNVMS